jgi:hypothetical protein
MKNIIIIALLLGTSNKIIAQNVGISYDTCNQLSKFAGEWRYVNGLDTIRIYLRPHREITMEDGQVSFLTDRLRGWHEYKIGNNVIESNYQYRFSTLPSVYNALQPRNYSIFLTMNTMYCSCAPNARKLIGEIKDFHQAGEWHNAFATVSIDLTTMTWKQGHAEWYGVWTGATGMTLPTDFILTKQP